MNFSKRPVIIEGVNHSGTRLIVDILSDFGSDAGDVNNVWRENTLFLKLHNELIERVSNKGWTKTILDNDFIKYFEDDLTHRFFVKEYLSENLSSHFPYNKDKIWHWKCPTSALFEKTWTSLFPNAYYIINLRDHAKIARSFVRRNASLPFDEGLIFAETMEKKILSITKKNQIIVNFDKLLSDQGEIERIADFLPIKINDEQIIKSKLLIDNKRNSLFSFKRSLKMNYKYFKANYQYNKYRRNSK